MPDRPNPYLVPSWPKTFLSRDLWNSVFGDVDNRLGLVEQKAASFAALEAQGIQASLDYIQANVAEQLVTLQHSITLAQDQIEQITIGGKIPNALLPERLRAYPEYVADWNNVRESGLYFGGPDTLNTPAQPYVFVGDIEARESSYVVQRLTAVGIKNPAFNVKFERQIVNNVPSTWARVLDTEVELDARYNRLSQPVANSQLPDRLKPYGRVITDWNNAIDNGFYFADSAANSPPGINGGLIGRTEAINGNNLVQTVTRWWGINEATSATWRRVKYSAEDWTEWFYQLTNIGELDARYNRRGVAIPKDQLPALMNTTRFDGYVAARSGAGSDNGYIQMSSGDVDHTGFLEIREASGLRAGYIGYANNTLKGINVTAENGYRFAFATSGGRLPAIDGQDIRTAATAYAKSETYTQAETQSLVTTARRVRLGGIGEIGTTTFQWNEAPAGCVLTGAFVDGNWGVRNIRYRGLHQTDLSGNWVVVAQS